MRHLELTKNYLRWSFWVTLLWAKFYPKWFKSYGIFNEKCFYVLSKFETWNTHRHRLKLCLKSCHGVICYADTYFSFLVHPNRLTHTYVIIIALLTGKHLRNRNIIGISIYLLTNYWKLGTNFLQYSKKSSREGLSSVFRTFPTLAICNIFTLY